MTNTLPKGDNDVEFGHEMSPGVYDIKRLKGQTLDEIRAFIDAASALHGGGSKLHLRLNKSRGHGEDYIYLDLEADIIAVENARAKLTPEERKILGVK